MVLMLVVAMKQARKPYDSPSLGLTQLTLVEHALCPLDAKASLQAGFCQETNYRYTELDGKRETARVRVTCRDGLSASDELYLWGLLALTFAQPSPSPEFYATPHYCLRQLGIVTPNSKGGKSYRLFRESLRRLSGVHYENDRFFDPLRKEHREVAFGLFGYSLPLDERSNREWRIIWDTQFFEYCRATGGGLRFDLSVYRHLDPAARRLYLLLQKVFYRRKRSPRFGVRELAVAALGFSTSQPINKLKEKVLRCSHVLADSGCIAKVPTVVSRGDGGYVQFERGVRVGLPLLSDVRCGFPIVEPLQRLGFDEKSIRGVLKKYDQKLIRVWCDVALAAVEQKQPGFFKRSPAAFLIDNLKAASRGERTPPDWFIDLKKQEQRRRAEKAKPKASNKSPQLTRAIDPELAGKSLIQEMTAQFIAAGQPASTARRNAEQMALAKCTAQK